MFRTSQKYLWAKRRCGDRSHPYGNIITFTIQSNRSMILTSCRYKTPNLNSRNFYDLLGVERTATQKEIKKAFFKLSKEYHPDLNSCDKSLHDKFVKINEAFSILNKQSTRITYDQSLNSLSRYPYQTYPRQQPFDYSNMNFGNRSAYQRRSNTNESNWDRSHNDKAFYEMLRRKMEYDRQRANPYSYYQSSSNDIHNTYFAQISIVLIIIGFGMFIHALQWRIKHFSDPQFATDPRTRHYHAYREWQRLSALKDAESMPIQRESSSSSIDEE